ncbi:MAG: hypothetical protein JWO31_1234 [Phycisphaerales bacterium]|nr:hypothetical protein [Phycisphaerales bacterium]
MFTRTWGIALSAGPLLGAPVIAADATRFELTPRHRLAFDGRVADANEKSPGLEFGVLPTHPVRVERRLNAWNQFEPHVEPAVEHPVPVLRGAPVRLYADRPEVTKLGLDQVRAFDRQATVRDDSRFAIVADGDRAVRLISFSKISLPQDRVDDWRITGTSEPLALPEHVDDPVADRGRAVESDRPLLLTGKLVFGKQDDDRRTPMAFHRYDFATGREETVGVGHSATMAVNGTVIDCPDTRTVDVTDKAGKRLAHLTFDRGDVKQFAVSSDGKRFALVIDRFQNVYAPVHESVVTVYTAAGDKLGEIVGFDDPAFFPDGRLLLTAPGIQPGLFVGDARTGKAELLAVHDGPGGQAKVDWPKNPVVSPDGKWNAYQTRNHGVALVGTDGRGWQEVWTNTNQPQASPTFSPDSRFIAMVVLQPEHWTGQGTVNVFDVRNHVRQPLKATQGAYSEFALTWMPD